MVLIYFWRNQLTKTEKDISQYLSHFDKQKMYKNEDFEWPTGSSRVETVALLPQLVSFSLWNLPKVTHWSFSYIVEI